VRAVVVEVVGLEVFAHHGVHAEEREHGQRFVLDVRLECPAIAAADTDELADAVDYSAVCDRVVELATGGPYRLIERLAAIIADDLAALPGVARARVRVAKPDAPISHNLETVAVTAQSPPPG
jgi:dihydroneopterin aldolase